MGKGTKVAVIIVAVLSIASTPLFWLLEDPNAGQLVGASVQAAAGVLALLWALFHGRGQSGPADVVKDTGEARGTGGGRANTGVRRPKGRGEGSAKVTKTGKATASGDGSRANSGIDYS